MRALPRRSARGARSRSERGGPSRYERDGVVFGNREGLLPAPSARLLSRVHRADAGRAQPRRTPHRLRRRRRSRRTRASTPPTTTSPSRGSANEGARSYERRRSRRARVVRLGRAAAGRAAAHAHLAFAAVDLTHAKDRTALFAALDKSLALPDHFGHNWDALADVLEDRDWLGKHGRVIAFTGSRRVPHASIRPTGRRSRTSWPRPRSSGRSVTSPSGCSSRNRSRASRRSRYKIPISTLVVVYTRDLDVLLHRARRLSRALAVGDRQPGAGRTLAQTAARELREETGIDADAYGGVVDWHMQNDFEIFTQVVGTLSARHDAQHRARVRPRRARARAGHARAARAPAIRVAAVARRRGAMLFVDQPRGDRGAARMRKSKGHRMKRLILLAGRACVRGCDAGRPIRRRPVPVGLAHRVGDDERAERPHVRVAAHRSGQRRPRSRRRRSERQDGKAIARAKATPGVEVTTSGYSSYQITDKLITRWRVRSRCRSKARDFAALAALLTQAAGGGRLVLSGMSFGVSSDARRKAEDALTQQAIKAGRRARRARRKRSASMRGASAASASMTGEPPMRPQPMMRVQAMPRAARRR